MNVWGCPLQAKMQSQQLPNPGTIRELRKRAVQSLAAAYAANLDLDDNRKLR